MLEIKGKCIVRTYSAGVFFGEVSERVGRETRIKNVRRIWSWNGAATLSELAEKGTSKPNECKFPASIPEIVVTETIEIIPCSSKSVESLEGVPVWTNH